MYQKCTRSHHEKAEKTALNLCFGRIFLTYEKFFYLTLHSAMVRFPLLVRFMINKSAERMLLIAMI